MEIHVIQEDRDIGSVDVLTELAQDVGLNRQGFATALLERRYRQAYRVARAQARGAGVTGVPTFHIGGQRLSGHAGDDSTLCITDTRQHAARSTRPCPSRKTACPSSPS